MVPGCSNIEAADKSRLLRILWDVFDSFQRRGPLADVIVTAHCISLRKKNSSTDISPKHVTDSPTFSDVLRRSPTDLNGPKFDAAISKIEDIRRV